MTALTMGREMAESRMSETVTVGRITRNSPNPDTLEPVPDTFELHYPTAGNGLARIKYPSLTVSESSTLGQVFASRDVVLQIPVGTGLAIRVDDIVTVAASTVDTSLVGRRFRVKGSAQGGQVTSSRFPVEEVS